MALSGNKLASVVVLVFLGLYFALDHTLSPFNHEAIGIGTMHSVHTIFGIVLLVIAVAVWYMDKNSKSKK
ncbi:MAG: hypothetical protein HY515_03645 [Candidatus Aenigmarchaeota archaeon]|nr:hypothetical protein [Candidatus Aenigmarchaeota archaeon]